MHESEIAGVNGKATAPEGRAKSVYRVLVCGGRDFADAALVNATLDAMHAQKPFAVLIYGGAPGADDLARRWAEANGVARLGFPAQWGKHGKAAGPIRNQRMLDKGRPDIVVAFPGGTGTADMVRRAKDADVAVRAVAAPVTSPAGSPSPHKRQRPG